MKSEKLTQGQRKPFILRGHKTQVPSPYRVNIWIVYLRQLVLWFLVSCVIGAILIVIVGENPLSVYSAIIVEGFFTQRGIMIGIQRSTPLILASVAAVIAFQGGAINMGLEGQVLVGAAVASLIGANLPEMPKIIAIIIVLICCGLGGALAGLLPAVFKMVSGINEVITGMIANLMMPSLISIMLGLPGIRLLRRAAAQNGILPWATLSQFNELTQGGLGFGTKANTGIFISVALVFVMALIMKRTKMGYEIRMSSANFNLASFAGIKANRRFYTTFMLSGAIAAIAGATEILGVWRGYYTNPISVGYTGLVVALVGGNTFVGSLFASLIYGGSQSGTLNAAWYTGIPRPFINILIEVLFLFSAIPSMRLFFTAKGDSGKERLGTGFTEAG